MKWNRIWKRHTTNYRLPAIVLVEMKKKTAASLEIEPLLVHKKEEEHGKNNTSLAIYSVLLEVLQNRPTHLYQFLQNKNHRLCVFYYSN